MADTTDNIEDKPLGEALSERYLSYALSTIMNRALPDVRDGLKPVHRRLLYAMRQLRLDPGSGFKKSARVVGDVIGRYHPHGETAIYDALVRLAQDFTVRYPLIDGQGNFGNIDGDNAAAMRYTEARLTEYAEALLEGIDQDTVDFRDTYDGDDSEPVVLPAGFPNVLANGASGIAVGMATSIPPHNIGELCDALIHLIKHPGASSATLMKFVPGPDFPTGGIIVDDAAAIRSAYETGKGSFRVRARWEKEEGSRGAYQIVITEMPYQVQKSKLIERIADLIMSRKMPLLADIRDESDAEVRLVLEPKSRMTDPNVLMEQIFQLTDLEARVQLNMTVLDKNHVPRVMSLAEVLRAFLDHRLEVLIRRTTFRLDKIEHRLEVLDGLLIAYLNLDEVIRIIRYEDEPKAVLIKTFDLTDLQAESILNMRLRSLRKLEEMEIRREHKDLTAEARELKKLLKSEDLQWRKITDETRTMKERFGQKTKNGKRRTAFEEIPEIDVEIIELRTRKEPSTVICGDRGWIRTMRGHVDKGDDLKFKEGDRLRFIFHAETTDKVVLFGTNGRFYTLEADKLPRGRGHGEPVRLMIDLDNDHDIVALFRHVPGRTLLVASTKGYGFQVAESDVIASKRGGKQVLNVPADAEAAVVTEANGDTVATIGDNRKLLLFPLDEVPLMARGKGVVLQKFRDGGLRDVCVFHLQQGLVCIDPSGRDRTFEDLGDWMGKRAQAGRLTPKGFPRSGRFGRAL